MWQFLSFVVYYRLSWGKSLQTSNPHWPSTSKLTFLSHHSSKTRHNMNFPPQHTCGLRKTLLCSHKAFISPTNETHTHTTYPSAKPSETGREHSNQDLMGDSGSRGLSKQRTYKEAHMERLGSIQGLKREKSRGE